MVDDPLKDYQKDKISLRELKMLKPGTKIILKAITEVKIYQGKKK
jgi:hypothetical protein